MWLDKRGWKLFTTKEENLDWGLSSRKKKVSRSYRYNLRTKLKKHQTSKAKLLAEYRDNNTVWCDTANVKNKYQTYLNIFQTSLSVACIYSVTHNATSTSVQQLSTHHLHISADETMSVRGVFDDLGDVPDCPWHLIYQLNFCSFQQKCRDNMRCKYGLVHFHGQFDPSITVNQQP